MSEDNRTLDVLLRLKRLIDKVDLAKADQALAERCLRRLEQPLRLTVFGTSPKHAVSLVNLMIGKPLVEPSIPRARILFGHDEVVHARVHYSDGTHKRIEESGFPTLFDDDPTRIRIYADLPVLKKLSILVSAEPDSTKLCADFEKTLLAADIALWAGVEFTEPMKSVWKSLPDQLRDHSYLVLSPSMEIASWKSIQQEFAEVLQVDPRRAQEAKKGKKGVDKAAFRDAGGTQIVKTIKKEIDAFAQYALDASEVLFVRYADQLDTVEKPSVPKIAAFESSRSLSAVRPGDVPGKAPSPIGDKPPGRVKSVSQREQIQSDPQAAKSMSRVNAHMNSQSAPQPRVRSRRSLPPATPWSLDL